MKKRVNKRKIVKKNEQKKENDDKKVIENLRENERETEINERKKKRA